MKRNTDPLPESLIPLSEAFYYYYRKIPEAAGIETEIDAATEELDEAIGGSRMALKSAEARWHRAYDVREILLSKAEHAFREEIGKPEGPQAFVRDPDSRE